MAKLLIVEDSQTIRQILSTHLVDQAFEVLLARDGQEALSTLKEHSIDLVLLDILMPKMDGLELLKLLRQSHSALELPIIMVTSRSRSDDVVTAMRLGANDYVTKPMDFEVMLARIKTHLELKRLADLRDEFLSIASHDLKKPLAVIIDMATFLAEETKPGLPVSTETSEILDHILKSGNYMKNLIEAFLDLSALEAGQIKLEKESLDFNQLVGRVLDNNLEYARRKENCLVFAPSPLPQIRADGGRLEQVLENLVGNAIKFSPPGAETRLVTDRGPNGVKVEIIDSGPGLRPEDFQQVFRKHARMTNKPTGNETSSGLGLAISKQIVEMHGGEIGVHNNPGQGATFWFRLPKGT